MDYKTLGTTDCKISQLTLGTMTWGQQNTEQEAWQQLDYAIDRGINIIDTAEMYPVPSQAKTYGLTETYIGRWLKSRKNRDKIVLATKVCGPAKLNYIRDGGLDLDRKNIIQAVTKSLQRLQTDYIDLYQLHWPSRNTNFFGSLYYQCNDDPSCSMLETLQVMAELVKKGLIRYIGVSNETPWGIMNFLSLSQTHDLPRVVSVQNPYNLLNRSAEVGLSELCWQEKVAFLPYSPMAFGALSGKYLNDSWPENARLTLFKEFSRYSHDQAIAAISDYSALAKEHAMDPAQMSLAFVTQRPFVTSNIIGATNMAQLKTNIDSATITLSDELYNSIEELCQIHSNPCP